MRGCWKAYHPLLELPRLFTFFDRVHASRVLLSLCGLSTVVVACAYASLDCRLGAFTHNVKLVLNENLSGILGSTQC